MSFEFFDFLLDFFPVIFIFEPQMLLGPMNLKLSKAAPVIVLSMNKVM